MDFFEREWPNVLDDAEEDDEGPPPTTKEMTPIEKRLFCREISLIFGCQTNLYNFIFSVYACRGDLLNIITFSLDIGIDKVIPMPVYHTEGIPGICFF